MSKSKNVAKAVKTPAKKAVVKTKVPSATTVELKAKRAEVKKLNAAIKVLVAKARKEREASAKTRKDAAAKRKADAIAKAKKRLDDLLNPAGHKARKAAQKPGEVTVVAPEPVITLDVAIPAETTPAAPIPVVA